ncbi:hypothetical protein COS81_01865 [candidate division WWE3 bacterium CG06_land_8_20_14_3_00_42_16]|uniref:Amino acid transporter transmembrane domain-containing protein n=4 Tax=Katanobacteria TaxID=422282 RepID=A0A2M7ANP5_UNCKA|nr:MAG: hypothetical protein COS81_01865 [candidate division WWE3 bacterium CG06_land_8_20_14_3_00_42_16]PIZ42196.1 MAG: hypothetical protein COY34_03240 [candidate division WWE3 bacterium CG_4_10_14_0_2_um_filter_42_8]PJA37374.1 MAG: hypothetical protein CO181_03740 [candidate division WWE3 bacterium CG_4_9_14_3_um_filter_43_9]PJC69212.1 MAG: hypothetical protein CO015_01135 [candidate division WWE3 bacterium CG_4_8_14_3_um_filter_42_11]
MEKRMIDRKILRASAMLIGTIIGAGIFGIPYAFSKIGFWAGVGYLIVLGTVVLMLNLSHGEVVLSTHGRHQLSGYAEKYLGKKGKVLALLSMFFGFYGALTAYIIKVGEFLRTLTSTGSSFGWSLIFFGVMAFLVLLGVKLISRFQLVLGFLLIIVLVLICGMGLSWFNPSNLSHFDPSFFFMPYGVILFALGGASIIPEMGGIFKREERGKLKKAIIFGTVIPITLYCIFALVIVGITGLNTSDDAIGGLVNLHPFMTYLGAFLGTLTMSSTFLSLGTILKDLYHYDFHFPPFLAWAAACFIPLLLFISGVTEFITLIMMAGSLMGGFEGIVIIYSHRKAQIAGDKKPEFSIRIPTSIEYILIVVFALGVVYEIVSFLQKV